MIYLYFDKNGVLKEAIQSQGLRVGSVNVKGIAIYCELFDDTDITLNDIWYTQKNPDGRNTNEISIKDNYIEQSIPYNAKADYKYFKDFQTYKFYYVEFTTQYTSQKGLCLGTVRLTFDNEIYALGEITFNVEENVIKNDNYITQSQYDYLLLAYANRTLNATVGQDLDALIEQKVDANLGTQIEENMEVYKTEIEEDLQNYKNEIDNEINTFEGNVNGNITDFKNEINKEIANQNETISSLGQLQPQGTATSTTILGYTYNRGIWIGTDTGHWYYWNGTQYVDGGVYQAAQITWDNLPKGSLKNLGDITENVAPYNDCNTLPSNTYMRIRNFTPLNSPKENITAMTIITISSSNSEQANNTTFQIANCDNHIYIRAYKGNWSEPIDTTSNKISFNSIRIDNTTTYNDFNTIPQNSIALINTLDLNNAPINKIGTLISYNYSKLNDVQNGNVQLYITLTNELYVRIRWSNNWSDWVNLSTIQDISNLQQQIDDISLMGDKNITFSTYQRIGVLGDSYASGCYGDTPDSTSAPEHYSVSWPQILARKYGVNVYNYTKGGMSTRSFLTQQQYGLPKLLTTPQCDLYLMVLERNDYNIEIRGESGYLGSINDIMSGTYETYPNTFYGNYGKIIEQVMNYAPNSKIVLISGDYTASNVLGTQYNNAVVEIAQHYNLPYIRELDDNYFNSSYYRNNWPSGGHPGVLQYSGMVSAFERLFNTCVKNNFDYFKYYLPYSE